MVLRSGALALLMLAAIHPASAQARSEGDWSFSGQVAAATDYRFRGMSLSGKEPQATAQVAVNHASGFYGMVWASNADLGSGADDIETDLVLGWSTDLQGLSLDIGGTLYAFPGNARFNYVELQASLSRKLGAATLKLGGAYAPSQQNIGGTDNAYFYLAGDLPISGDRLVARGSFGIEDGAFGKAKRDWKLGLRYDLGGGASATLDYIDTARAPGAMGKAAVVGALAWDF